MSERVQWIDIAKGLGILLVMVGHTRLVNTGVGHWLTQFHLPLFFVMAGLCFDETRYLNYGEYAKRKCLALGYPFVMLSLFVAALFGILNFDPKFNMSDLMVETLKGRSLGSLWFVTALFFVEVAFAGLSRLVKGVWARAFVCVMCAIVGWGLSCHRGPNLWAEFPTICYAMIFYWFGWACRGYVAVCRTSHWLWPAAIGLGVASVLTSFLTDHYYSLARLILHNPIRFAVVAVIGSAFVSTCSMLLERWTYSTKLLTWFGRNSIIILVTHVAAGECKKSWGINGLAGYVLEYILFIVITLLIAYPLNFLVRPSRK